VDLPNEFHVVDFTDAETYQPEEPNKKAASMDKWEGEDDEDDVKVSETLGPEPACAGVTVEPAVSRARLMSR